MRLQAAIPNPTYLGYTRPPPISRKRPCGTTPHRDRWAAIVSRLPLYSPISDSDKSGRRSVGDRTRPAISARFRAGVGGCAITRASRAGLRAENWSQPDGDRQNRGSIDRIHHPLGVAAYHINSSRAATGDGVSRIGAVGCAVSVTAAHLPPLRFGSVRPPSLRRGGSGGRFLVSLLNRKRPASTQPFMPGSQIRSLTCWQMPLSSCGQPQPPINFPPALVEPRKNRPPPVREAF